MPDYINCGARLGGERITTKSALKRYVKGNAPITFDSTSFIGKHAGKIYFLSDLTTDMVYSVCGPDPFTNRVWYATVQLNKHGQATVK